MEERAIVLLTPSLNMQNITVTFFSYVKKLQK